MLGARSSSQSSTACLDKLQIWVGETVIFLAESAPAISLIARRQVRCRRNADSRRRGILAASQSYRQIGFRLIATASGRSHTFPMSLSSRRKGATLEEI